MDRYDHYTDKFVKDAKAETIVYSNKTLVIQADNKLDEPVFLTGICGTSKLNREGKLMRDRRIDLPRSIDFIKEREVGG